MILETWELVLVGAFVGFLMGAFIALILWFVCTDPVIKRKREKKKIYDEGFRDGQKAARGLLDEEKEFKRNGT